MATVAEGSNNGVEAIKFRFHHASIRKETEKKMKKKSRKYARNNDNDFHCAGNN